MFSISFGRWAHAGGKRYIAHRIYWQGWRWTPFVRLARRYPF